MRQLTLVFLLSFNVLLAFSQQKDSVYTAEMKLPGVKMITVFGKYQIWTRKLGDSRIKVLLLHGGPGNTHEYLESLATYLANNGVEVYLYDQLGSYFSDQPPVVGGDTIWKMPMRVAEVEAVRKALGLKDFYLYGHSYGAALGLAYLKKYPGSIKGLIFSSMNTEKTHEDVRNKVVSMEIDSMIRLDTTGKEIMKLKDARLPYDTAKYEDLAGLFFLRNYLVRTKSTPDVLKKMNHHNNYKAGGEILKSLNSDQYLKPDLAKINIPVLLIAGDHDFTVSYEDLQIIHSQLNNSTLYICQNSGHMSMLDAPNTYDTQILKFLINVDLNQSKPK